VSAGDYLNWAAELEMGTETTFNPRKLAAIDITLLGPKVIVEFAGSVLLCAALGGFVLLRGHRSILQFLLGFYFISLGINYIPMLIYARAIGGANNAREELGDELTDKREAMKKYRRQSLFLLVPLAVAIFELAQRRKA